MQEVLTLLKKIEMLANQEQHSQIDIDLMLDHTKAVYSLLLDKKDGSSARIAPTAPLTTEADEDKDILGMPLTLPESVEERNELVDDIPEVATIMDRPGVDEAENLAQYHDRDIRKHIGFNDKYLFISELFENDKEAYERALNEINRCTFCREATDWLTQQARGRYNWDHESDAVQSFYGIVSHFFASR